MPNAVLPLRLGVGSLLCRCCTIVLTTIRLLVEGLIFVPPLLSKNGAGGILYSGLSVCQWVCESVSRGKAETEVFRAQDWDEVEAFMCGAVLRVAAVAWFPIKLRLSHFCWLSFKLKLMSWTTNTKGRFQSCAVEHSSNGRCKRSWICHQMETDKLTNILPGMCTRPSLSRLRRRGWEAQAKTN